VTLELGGKSAHIIFDDAEIEPAIAAAATGVWSATGQVCAAGSRCSSSGGLRRGHRRLAHASASCASVTVDPT